LKGLNGLDLEELEASVEEALQRTRGVTNTQYGLVLLQDICVIFNVIIIFQEPPSQLKFSLNLPMIFYAATLV
jgi:hypothetical protein